MSQKLHKMDYCIPKLELPIMLLLKFGVKNLMILSQIFGLWAVFSMKLQPWMFLSKLKIWKD